MKSFLTNDNSQVNSETKIVLSEKIELTLTPEIMYSQLSDYPELYQSINSFEFNIFKFSYDVGR